MVFKRLHVLRMKIGYKRYSNKFNFTKLILNQKQIGPKHFEVLIGKNKILNNNFQPTRSPN